MIKPFKVTTKHLRKYSELDNTDLGLYAIQVRDGQDLMLYETKYIAQKAYEYFEKNFKMVK